MDVEEGQSSSPRSTCRPWTHASSEKSRCLGLGVTLRMAFIDEFLDKHHVLLAGLQEGRLPVAGLLDLPNYFAYTAPATEDGQGGVQCWVHHSLRGSVVRAGCNPQSPRLLRLELSGGPLVATVLVAHAPVSSAELAAKTAF